MGMDNIQLKQEDVLDGQPVLSDINPVTNTNSVDNPATGEKLDETISRMWSTINNKLTRIVNSVNGRTGVIVLTAEDVGLGDVDNVSYAEIKQWVRETMEGEFANRALKLYHSLAEALAVCATNDRSYVGTPFYCDITNDSDKRAAIGFYYWDNNELKADHAVINTIGGTDASINYENGTISVKIHPDEHALYVETNGGEGLRIDESKLRGNIYFFDCLYGKGSQTSLVSDTTSLLATNPDNRGDVIEIYINDQLSNDNPNLANYLNTGWDGTLVKGDMIFTNFKYRGVSPYTDYVDTGLMGQQPAFGIVTQAPDADLQITTYEIRFYTIRPFVGETGGKASGFGLCYYDTHTSDPNVTPSTGMLGIKPSLGPRHFGDEGDDIYYENLSGVNAFARVVPNTGDPKTGTSYAQSGESSIFTPWGMESTINATNFGGGVSIGTDVSIGKFAYPPLIPSGDSYIANGNEYYFGSARVRNWVHPMAFSVLNVIGDRRDPTSLMHNRNAVGQATNTSALLVNTNKAVYVINPAPINHPEQRNDEMYKFMDVSGLRIVGPSDATGVVNQQAVEFSYDDMVNIGLADGFDATGQFVDPEELKYFWFSGGLAVNVGKFLEIRPIPTERAADYNTGGKVQVRIGPGLEEDTFYEMIDPDRIGFVYDKNARYFMHDQATAEPSWTEITFSTDMLYNLTESEPEDWDKTYTEHYTIEDPNAATPVFIPVPRVYDGDIPSWEADTYYAFNSTAPVVYLQTLQDGGFVLAKLTSTNRFRIKVDHETTEIDPDTGALKVVGGVGGQNIRVVDDRGCYFDTVPNRTKVDEVLKLGAGLKVVGGCIPDDLAYGVSTLKSCVLETLGAASAVEILDYMITHPDPPDYTVLTTATLQSIASGRTSLTTALSVPGVTKETIQSIGDALYDSAENVKDVLTDSTVRLYMTDGETSISSRVAQLYESIDEDTTNRTAYFTAIKAHYGLTGDATKENLTSQIFTMPFYDSSQTNPYLFDWLFSLGFTENG